MIRKIQVIITSRGKRYASVFNASPEEAQSFDPDNLYAHHEISPAGDLLLTNLFDASDPENAETALTELYGELQLALSEIQLKVENFMDKIDEGEICEDKFYSKESE